MMRLWCRLIGHRWEPVQAQLNYNKPVNVGSDACTRCWSVRRDQ